MVKKVIILALLVVSMTALFAAKAPSFTIETLEGDIVRSEALLEKGPIFLDFWSTSCAPCLKALPHFNEFAKKYKDMNFVAVSTDSPRNKNKVVQMVRSNRWVFINGFDSSKELQRLFNVTAIPRTIIINQAGEIVYDSTSFTPGDEKKYEEQIIKVLQAGKE